MNFQKVFYEVIKEMHLIMHLFFILFASGNTLANMFCTGF